MKFLSKKSWLNWKDEIESEKFLSPLGNKEADRLAKEASLEVAAI